MNMEATLDTIAAMRHQEVNVYQTRDFLSLKDCNCLSVDEDCRAKMAAWCYQVVDFCEFNREIVEIAMNFLDRFILTSAGSSVLHDRALYQLACMTTLYTAIKINEPEAISPSVVSELSKGIYTAQEVEVMEFHILNALQWRVNPPTVMSFVRQFLELIPEYALPEPVRTALYEVVKFQAELAVSDYGLIAVKPSTLAFTSIVNALESMKLDEKLRNNISHLLAHRIGVGQITDSLRQIRSFLLAAVVEKEPQISATLQTLPATKLSTPSGSFDTSPRSIATVRQRN